jgi:large subunit ribosomal protein L25
MATLTNNLEAEPREETGQSSNRELRENSKIPAVVYGKNVDNQNLAVRKGDIEPLLKDGALNNRLLELDVEGDDQERNVLIKDIDLDPVTDGLLHVDFHQVRPSDEVEVEIPVELVGESPGVELDGGIVDQPMRTLTVACKVEDIPEQIEVDIGELEIGDAIFVSDVTTPRGVTLQNDESRTIVSIQPPEEFDLETTPAEGAEAIEETVEEAMEEVAEAEEEELEEGEEAEGVEGEPAAGEEEGEADAEI